MRLHSVPSFNSTKTFLVKKMLLPWNETNFAYNILIICGFWHPNGNGPKKRRIYRAYKAFVWIFFLVLFNILQYIDLYLVRDDLEKISLNFCLTILFTYAGLFTLVSVRKYECINHLRADFVNDRNNEKWHLKGAKEIKIGIQIIFGAAWLSLNLWLFFPLLSFDSERKVLPFRQWVPFRLSYCVAYVYQILASYAVVNYTTAFAFIFYSSFIPIITDYELLEEKIQLVKDVWYREINKYVKEREILRLMRAIVTQHQRILNRIEQYKNAFNMFLLIQFSASAIIFVLLGLNVLSIILKGIEPTLLPQIVLFTISLIYNFIICFHGTRIDEKSYFIADEMYDTPWYEMSPRLRKYALTIIHKAQKPPKVSAGKLFRINLDLFSNILKMSYQFFMFFRPFIMEIERGKEYSQE